MKKNSETQGVSDLLKKLQASYLGNKEPEKKKQEKIDADDEKFRAKLAAMLGKATGSSDQPKKKNSQKSTKKPSEAQKKEKIEPPAPTVSTLAEVSDGEHTLAVDATETVIEELTAEVTPAPAIVAPQKLEEVAEELPTIEEVTPAPKPRRKRKAPQPKKKKEETPASKPVGETVGETIGEAVVEPIVEPSIEPTAQTVIEPTIETIVEQAIEPIEEPTEEQIDEPIEDSIIEDKQETADAPRDTVIVIPAPRYEETDSEPLLQESAKSEPIRIVPRVTIPPCSDTYDFAKKKDPHSNEPIVIRPNTQAPKPSESIVIRPRAKDKPLAAPQLQTEPAPTQPIKIGKEVRSDQQTEAPKPTMKKEKSVTFIPPTPLTNDEDKPAKKQATTTRASVATTPKKRRLQRFVSDVPVTIAESHDEDLEEVLDEPITDTENIIEEISVEEPEELPTPPSKLPIFQRRQLQRKKIAEEKLSAAELIRKKSGLSEDDVAMILELGYENELGRLVGYENLKRLKSEHVKKSKSPREEQYGTAFGYRGAEYANDNQKDTAIAAYVHDRKSVLLRLCLTSLLSLLLLFVEMPHLVGGFLEEPLSMPRLLPLASTLLLATIALLSWKQIHSGMRAFFRFTPTPYSVPALVLPVAFLHNLALLVMGTEGIRISLPAALSLLLITVCDVLRLSCELRTLRLISAEGEKQVLVAATPRKKKLRHGKKIVKIINDDDGEPRYEIRSATQTVGFFRRHNSFDSATRPFTVLLYTVFALATLTAFFGAIFTSSVTSAVSTFMITVALGMPLSAIWVYFYPLCHANRLLSRRNCALIGEEAVEEFDCPKTLIFHDTDLCKVKACTEIAVRDGDDFRNDLRLSCILFRKLGGTLTSLGDSVPPLTKGDPDTAIVRIMDDGVEAVVDHRYHVLAGSAEFLRRSGIRVPRESSDKALRRTTDTSPMYVAVDGVLKLNYEVQYSISNNFESLIRDLSEGACNVSVYSYDPNLTNDFLSPLRGENAEPIRVVKPGRLEDEHPLDLADTGAVALGKHTDLVYPTYAASSIGAVRRFGFRMQWISTLLGAGIAVLLLLLGEQGLLSVLAIAGYHVFWLIVSTLATHSEINREKLRMK